MLTASGFPQIRTLGYCCQLVGGVLVEQCPARSEVGTRLLALSSQLSHCRTVLRLFDDVAMFVYTKQYGLGAEVTGRIGLKGGGVDPGKSASYGLVFIKAIMWAVYYVFQFYFFFFFLATLHSMWDLSSLTRDGTCAPCIGSVES